MNKKIIAIIVSSIILFIFVTAGMFFGLYTVTEKMMESELGEYTDEEDSGALTKDMLEDTSDEDLEFEITYNIWYYTLNEDYDNEYELASKLPKSQKYLYATHLFEDHFNSGGFAQFFYTYSGEFTKEAIEGYRFFGAVRNAELVEKAAKLYEQETDIFEKAKADQSSNAFYKLYKKSKMSELDEEFERLLEDASKMKIKYIRAHLDEFTTE